MTVVALCRMVSPDGSVFCDSDRGHGGPCAWEGFAPTVVVHRVPNDRGSIHVRGEREPRELYLDDRCPCCGRVGYVAYCFEWLRVGNSTYNDGDDAFECIWCGAVVTRRDGFGWEGWTKLEQERKAEQQREVRRGRR